MALKRENSESLIVVESPKLLPKIGSVIVEYHGPVIGIIGKLLANADNATYINLHHYFDRSATVKNSALNGLV